MASLCRRAIFQTILRPIYTSAYRLEDKPVIPSLDLATGLEKAEKLAHIAGHKDPFDVKISEFGPGTKDCPNLVSSSFNSRIVGCICNSEQNHVRWMWLHKDAPKRCECGHWFKLVDRQPLEM